jgi:hypothetical protein
VHLYLKKATRDNTVCMCLDLLHCLQKVLAELKSLEG